jgi:apolipoprotein D and lipocalin family protein
MRIFALGGVLALLAFATPALAAAPQPVRPTPTTMYSGRWYQIFKIAAADPHPCHGATDDFAPIKGNGFQVTIACRDGGGKLKQISVKGAVVPGSAGAKFKVSFLGGLFHQEYWVLDHAADNAWALMATPGGQYLWVLSRTPVLADNQRLAALGAIKALGYDATRLTPDR